jgi:hypothetical protein
MIVANETDRWIAHLSYTIELKRNRILTEHLSTEHKKKSTYSLSLRSEQVSLSTHILNASLIKR